MSSYFLGLAFMGCSPKVSPPTVSVDKPTADLCPSGRELLANGGFEDPAIPEKTFRISPSLPGWSVSSGSGIEVQRRVTGSPAEGAQFVELDAETPTNIYQEVATAPDQALALCVKYSPRPGTNSAENAIEVLVNQASLQTLSVDGSGFSDTKWSSHVWKVRARAGVTRVEFRYLGPSNGIGGYLDAISLRSIP
jgi:hypothetical protein